MRDFVGAMCLWHGMGVILRLSSLGTGTLPTVTTGGLAWGAAISTVILVWGSVLLSKK